MLRELHAQPIPAPAGKIVGSGDGKSPARSYRQSRVRPSPGSSPACVRQPSSTIGRAVRPGPARALRVCGKTAGGKCKQGEVRGMPTVNSCMQNPDRSERDRKRHDPFRGLGPGPRVMHRAKLNESAGGRSDGASSAKAQRARTARLAGQRVGADHRRGSLFHKRSSKELDQTTEIPKVSWRGSRRRCLSRSVPASLIWSFCDYGSPPRETL